MVIGNAAGVTRLSLSVLLMLLIGSPSTAQEAMPHDSSHGKVLEVIFPATLCSTEMPDELITLFEEEYKMPVKKLNLCTGDADKLIRSDNHEPIDVIIGHEIDIENKLVADGYVINLREVLYSNFVLVGPKEDPAGIKGLKDPTKALAIIMKKKVPFFSRGDNSGTHGLEKRMWKLAKIEPKGDWYITTNTGTDATLEIANRKRGYTIVHYPSFIQQQETLTMEVMVDGNADNKLVTSYEVMAANPQKYPDVQYVDAMTFIGFLTSPKIQKYIANFGVEKFKRQTNFPLAVTDAPKPRGK
ncbi:MAG: substrate-binding domain-containing protein [Chitinivibrionales bacterium]|nr:substrate-binding domain-containing protein [Chitinivibrionales bacterium]